jgi:hypothetical protein
MDGVPSPSLLIENEVVLVTGKGWIAGVALQQEEDRRESLEDCWYI